MFQKFWMILIFFITFLLLLLSNLLLVKSKKRLDGPRREKKTKKKSCFFHLLFFIYILTNENTFALLGHHKCRPTWVFPNHQFLDVMGVYRLTIRKKKVRLMGLEHWPKCGLVTSRKQVCLSFQQHGNYTNRDI